jgi:hypothetical protein
MERTRRDFASLGALFAAQCWATQGWSQGASIPFSIIDLDGEAFVELSGQDEPQRVRWGSYGQTLDSFHGVEAYSQGQIDDGLRPASGGYQCTELVHRFVRNVFALPSRIGMGLGDGVYLARGIAEHFGGQAWGGGSVGAPAVSPRYFEGGWSTQRPTVGAIFSVSIPSRSGGTGPGHVALIRSLHADGDVLTGSVFEQHGFGSYPPEQKLRVGQVRFARAADSTWSGAYSSGPNTAYPIVGWTNFSVAMRASVPVLPHPRLAGTERDGFAGFQRLGDGVGNADFDLLAVFQLAVEAAGHAGGNDVAELRLEAVAVGGAEIEGVGA